eukprot:10073176-Alexandrium_andersonii.AAC.1
MRECTDAPRAKGTRGGGQRTPQAANARPPPRSPKAPTAASPVDPGASRGWGNKHSVHAQPVIGALSGA